MAFSNMRFGEKNLRNPPLKDRGLDSRFYGVQTQRRDPLNPSTLAPAYPQAQQTQPQQQHLRRSSSAGSTPLTASAIATPMGSTKGGVTPRGFGAPRVAPPAAAPNIKPTRPLYLPSNAEALNLFKRVDYNGNGFLSLAELDKATIELWPEYNNKPAILRAYRAADVDGDGFVTKEEFPLYLKYLARYNELWMAFTAMDANGDRRVTATEFITGKAAFGLKSRSDDEVRQIFNAIDINRGGVILFDELAEYIAGSELNAERQLIKTTIKRPTATKLPPKFLDLPSVAREQDLFARLDMNGNGMLSLAELDKAVVELWPQFNNKPALMRAYKAADTNGNGRLSRKEFKSFLIFLVVYENMFQRFAQIDRNGDRRLSLDEFLSAANNEGRSINELRSIFARIDSNNGGYILFDEFCEYEARRTLQQYLQANPTTGQLSTTQTYVPCIAGLLCHLCGRSLPDLDQHLPSCHALHVKAAQELPEFLHLSVPDMPLPIPKLPSQVALYNETAKRLYEGLSTITCPECSKRFHLLKFAGHLKTHSISYDRRMQLMKRVGKDVTDIALPSAVQRPDRVQVVDEVRRSLLNGFDTSNLNLLKRMLFLESKQNPMMNSAQLQKMLGKCGLVGPRTMPLDMCRVLLGTYDNVELGSAAALLAALDQPLSNARQGIVTGCYRELDGEGTSMVPFRTFRDRLICNDLLGLFVRPLEKAVTYREFEETAKDLSPSFSDDNTFWRLFEVKPIGNAALETFNVVATLSSGLKHVVRIEVPPGSVVRKDPKSLLRRLTLLGIQDAVKVELL